jgi:nicotinamidase/pyrazinamidase
MMDASNTVFVDVDTQRDFCEPDGALAVKGAPVEVFRRLTALAVEKRIPIVGSVDAHDFDDPEFETFPAHCVKGTPGQLKVEGTLPARSYFIPDALGDSAHDIHVGHQLRAGQASAVFFEKVHFSLYTNRYAVRILAELYRAGRTTAVVYGVATDYCVKAAVLGLREHGFDVVVVTDGIAGVSPETDVAARDEMIQAGAVFITEGEVFRALTKAA